MNTSFESLPRICVVGHGSWGTAIAKILTDSGNAINWFVSNQSVRQSIALNKMNNKYLTEVHFRKDTVIELFDDINEAVSCSDILIFAIPSAFLSEVLSKLTVGLADKMIVSAIKGIVPNTQGAYVTITEYFNQVMGVRYDNLGVLTGPCHAEEVARERLTYVNVVCKTLSIAEGIAKRINCSYMRTNALTDIYGAEYSAVLKNIYAIAVGVCKGLKYGDNFMAVLIANSQAEICQYLQDAYPFTREENTSAYLGDLLVTSYSQFSRNRTFGMMIGQGYSLNAARVELNDMIAEGYYAAKCIHDIVSSKRMKLPIAEAVYQILYENKSAAEVVNELTNKIK